MISEKQDKKLIIHIMESRKNTFLDYAYAGDKELMQKLFPDIAFEKINDDENYFKKIPDDTLEKLEVIKLYGRNLKKIRKEQQLSLEDVATPIGMSLEYLRQIEEGMPNKINRNDLLLLCGLYQVCPERLLGELAPPGKVAMKFYHEETLKKASFIVERLIDTDQSLLQFLVNLDNVSNHNRKKLLAFLRNIPILKLQRSDNIKLLIQTISYLPEEGNHVDWGTYIDRLCAFELIMPTILDIYISIAVSEKRVRKMVLELVSLAGFAK